jgi:hypothetical protein
VVKSFYSCKLDYNYIIIANPTNAMTTAIVAKIIQSPLNAAARAIRTRGTHKNSNIPFINLNIIYP